MKAGLKYPALYRPDTGEITSLLASDPQIYTPYRDTDTAEERLRKQYGYRKKHAKYRCAALRAAEKELENPETLQRAILMAQRCVPVQTVDPVGDALEVLAAWSRTH